ncbi:MAG: triose-phosphate isomerase [Nitriliruptorales bacterium]
MADRAPIMAGNWKMHKDHLEAIQLVQKLAYHLDEGDYDGQDVVVCPPFTALRAIQNVIASDDLAIQLGAQDCHWEEEGAYTGEVSPRMLARLEVRYVICGHSERRHLFGEDDETVNRKARAVIKAGMLPIVCVGETEQQRAAGEAREVVVAQLRGSLAGIGSDAADGMVIAYEPVWAIGTGRTATPDDAQEMCAAARETLSELYDDDVAARTRIQYGGSVKPGNVRDLMGEADIDGALVGGASLSADDFALIVGHRRP